MELSTNKNTENRFNISSLKHQSIRIEYRNETASLIDNRNLPTDNQNSWNRVTTMLEQAAKIPSVLSKNLKNLQMEMLKNSPYFNVL